ncbi:DsrE/DsrF-like protein [Ignavibacterium album JCM 16511]|uniref:DsrE/DsrF-like protein n=1 Tax=Ignavibacterium album (strain DSM 19864 / JCM 16511 / NBRC 101810 / Mat9-16) TaxID=945713 RepID=I0AIN5_IGNAJ|nr:DsrE family protein [Ignavibacterium album]AFH48842.1 DsrE/DsrF-like protein [Ignavibacterium album JCM 16511]
MKRATTYLLGVLLISFFVTSLQAQEKDKLQDKEGLFLHITTSYDNPHRLLMPLKMATMMANDKAVLIYMDIEAVKILVKGSKDITHPDFESAHTYIKKLLEMGVEIYACPTCLKVAGFKTEDLMDGIKPANKERFFNFTKGRILSLSY